MNNLSLRIYVLLCTVVMWLRAFAQMDDDEMGGGRGRGRGGDDDMGGMEEMVDYQPFHLTTQDIFTILFVIVACYVFGKIWRGCSYLILILAAIFYYMLR